ncbi:hypothetical protein P154DRAFT_539216 [Amniculicola lignicola CBS 123094]|uniref:Uncharacterized protein n=1 Tax=Amniculicola lignicola CBS 123094 TaxID=1392246 RepID=A0A6A5W0M0_9PLEO|nr:hypothetical protein P154DRAFT_539216 [Amniculicola lignicola CBS 123094]
MPKDTIANSMATPSALEANLAHPSQELTPHRCLSLTKVLVTASLSITSIILLVWLITSGNPATSTPHFAPTGMGSIIQEQQNSHKAFQPLPYIQNLVADSHPPLWTTDAPPPSLAVTPMPTQPPSTLQTLLSSSPDIKSASTSMPVTTAMKLEKRGHTGKTVRCFFHELFGVHAPECAGPP